VLAALHVEEASFLGAEDPSVQVEEVLLEAEAHSATEAEALQEAFQEVAVVASLVEPREAHLEDVADSNP
jgi:hypothetical protein